MKVISDKSLDVVSAHFFCFFILWVLNGKFFLSLLLIHLTMLNWLYNDDF